MTELEDRGHVFISYVREDAGRVDSLQARLESAGIPVWRDVKDLWPGKVWKRRLRDEISKNSLAFVPCFSRSLSERARSTMYEELIWASEEYRKRNPAVPWIFPVLFEECNVPAVDLGGDMTLHDLQWVQLAENPEPELERLITTLKGLFARSSRRKHADGDTPEEGPEGRRYSSGLNGPSRESIPAASNRQSIADSGPRQQSTVRRASLPDASIARTTPGSSVSPAADRSPSEVSARAPGPVRPPSTNVRRRPWIRSILALSGGLIVAAGVAAFIVFGGVIGNPVGESGTFKAELKNPRYVGYSLAFSRDGKTLAVGSSSSDGNNGCTYLWNLATRTITATLADQGSGVAAVAFSPDGKTLVVGSNSGGGIYLWSLATDKIITNFSNSLLGFSSVLTVEFSLDGKNLAEGDVTLDANLLADNVTHVRLWNIASGKVATSQTIPGGITKPGISIAFSPDGKTMAIGDGAGDVYLWSFADKRVTTLFTIQGGNSQVNSVEFSPDRQTLAVADSNGNIYLWSMANRHIEATLTGPRKNSVATLAFSPDGTTLAAGNSDGSTYLWNVAIRQATATLTDPRSKGVNSVAYSRDGTTLAVGDDDGNTYIWNITKR